MPPLVSPVYPTATTNSEPENISNKNIISNLDVVAAANDVVAADSDDDIDNEKSSPECKNSIGVLDGTRQDILNAESENDDYTYDCD